MCYALLKDKHVITFTSITLIFSLFSFFCISIVLGIAIVISLVCGLIAPVIIFSDKKPVPNFLSIFTGVVPKSYPKKEMVRSCSVCGGEECNRQHTTNAFNISAHAHVYFTVPQSIDEALEEIFNLVLDHHIYYWYKEISVHDQLADEIRYIIRYAAASLGTRLTKVDLPSIILDQLIPCGLVHVDSYVEGSRKVRGNSSLESSVIQYLKSKKALHVALQSREDEANYLRAVVNSLIPYLIPKQYQESSLAKCFLQELLGRFLILQGMDLLADPDIVNFLFLLLFDDESVPIPPDTPEPKVLLLKSFSSVNTHPRNSSMRSNLSSVLKDQNLLYLFHSFLKAEEAINILSFCLAVEDFNRHILDPELTSEQLQYLHKEALELYHTYMVPTAIDKLDFLPEIVSQIKEIVHGDVKDIVKLRTTRPLFQAYEYAYNLLEREYLPLFMNSNAYFSHICGLKHQQTFQRTSNRDAETVQSTSTLRGSLGKGVAQRVGIGLASLSRQMAFKPSVINGDEDVMATVDEGSDVYTVFLTEDGCTARNALEGLSHAFRDLSAWRVSIPRVEERIDSSGKMEFVFIVDVTRIDVSGENPEELHWEVERRYNEFYVLETKLTEFHGDFPDNNLPPRRSFFASKGTSFMHSRRQIFEGFLQKLLQNPSLRNSQLLFLFFKSKDEFTASYLPDVSLSRLLKEVPRKLIKERGQNLDAFISSFISSTTYYNSLKNVAFDVDKALYNDESKLKFSLPCEDIKLTEGLYCDNVQSLRLSNVEDGTSLTSPTTNVNGIVEIVLYIAIRLYGLSMTCLRVAMCFKILFGNTIDAGIAWFVRKKLNEAFRPPNLVKLIHLIRDALFFDPPSPRTKMDRLARESDIRDKVIHLLPKWMKKLFFVPELYIEGANTLVNSFQHPVLNKQLSYMLLDIILEELFPELKKREESDDTQYLSFLNRSSYVATS